MRILFFFSLFILVGCDFDPSLREEEKNPKSKLINEARRNAAYILSKEKNLRPMGTGAQARKKIKMLALSFGYYQPLTIEKARELLLSSCEVLITTVNSNERIRPYLDSYPFGPKNVEIRIFLYDSKGKKRAKGDLSIIKAIDGILKYETDDPENKFRSITVLKETYEEAMLKQSENLDNRT